METVQAYWADVLPYFNDAIDFAHEGFMRVNAVLGLLIAVVAAFMLNQYRPRAILATTIGATAVFIIAQMLVPVIDHNAALKLPDIMVAAFWRQLGLIAVGLFIVISILYFVRRIVLKTGGH